MAFFYDKDGIQQVKLDVNMYKAADDANKSVAHYINTLYPGADPAKGTAFQQLCASEGLTLAGDNQFGLRPATIADILDGKSGFNASANTQDRSTPFGSSSRTLFPAAVIQLIEDAIQPERETDSAIFNDMVAIRMPIGSDVFEQPVLSYANAGGANTGANAARAQRIAQLSQAPTMLTLTTSDRFRKIATYGVGIEMSAQAMRATSLDLLALTVGRFMQIEKDARIYGYLANTFAGDSDANVGAVAAVTSNSLDTAATGGVLTHKACVKFLATNRKRRHITHLVGDINAYLAWESRTGRPGSNNYDPTLARIDPQAVATNVGFGNDVKWFIVDAATDGGPVPANTVWALDKAQGIMMVNNTSAEYQATEAFVLRRSESMVWHWSEESFRLYGDTDLTPFAVLTIS